ncbi:MAG: mechanosensitive ion channel family protein [Chthoniobacterales bacterium]
MLATLLAAGPANPGRSLEVFGIKFVGVNAENGQKLLFTLGAIVVFLLLRRLLRWLARLVTPRDKEWLAFWIRQGITLATALLMLLTVLSIWFDQPSRLATALGLMTAGLAFALQKVVTAFAGYMVILRGNTFSVGDRIVMGGVRGDVIALGFLQTTIMEMGQPPSVEAAAPEVWVRSRQYTGRVVTVSNGQIFEEPVFNYTRDFPYLWEEIVIPVSYGDDRAKVEEILLDVGGRHSVNVTQVGHEALERMRRRYFVQDAEFDPKVYLRITDNWVELTLRFVVNERGVREVKDRMNREILSALEQAKIGIASGTYDIVGLPPIRIVTEQLAGNRKS